MNERPLEGLPPLWRGRLERLGDIAAGLHMDLCLVGGCVRDLALGRPPLDWDVAVDGTAAELVRRARGEWRLSDVTSHPRFLTHTLTFTDGTTLDVATARKETYPAPASLPVVSPAPLAEDLATRRDFTVNAMALRLTPGRWGEWEDPLHGRQDLQAGLLRVLHPKSFEDDPTRLHRAARYAGRYGWTFDPETDRLIQEAACSNWAARLSPARLRNELLHILEEADALPAMTLLWQWGLWKHWGEQWRRSSSLDRALQPQESVDLGVFRLAALLYDGGATEEDLKRLALPKVTRKEAASAAEAARKGQGTADLSSTGQAFFKRIITSR